MRILIVRPNRTPEINYIADDGDQQMRQIQYIVGGYYEAIPLPLDHFGLVNEEARVIGGFEENTVATVLYGKQYDLTPAPILGTMVVVGPLTTDKDESQNVTDEFITFLEDLKLMT